MPQPTPQYGQIDFVRSRFSAFVVPTIFLSVSAPVGHVLMHWPQNVQGDSRSLLLKNVAIEFSCPRPSTVIAPACSQSLQMFVQRKHEMQ